MVILTHGRLGCQVMGREGHKEHYPGSTLFTFAILNGNNPSRGFNRKYIRPLCVLRFHI